MWAPNATPPLLGSANAELTSCKTIQKPKTHIAFKRIVCKKIPNGISTRTRACGYNNTYAPKTPEMAPLAPIIGI